MKIYISLVAFILICTSVVSEAKPKNSNGTKIIEIKRTLSLNNDKRHYKEFYINAGTNKGLKKNHVIPVVRRKSFYDPLLNKSIGDLWLPVGEVKVIHVGSNVSVARIYKVPERQNLPEVEYPTFMVGDRIQTKKAKFIKKKSKTAKLNRKFKNGKSKRGIASVPNQKMSGYKYRKKLKKNLNFSDRIREEIAKPTNFESKGSEGAGGSSSTPAYRTE